MGCKIRSSCIHVCLEDGGDLLKQQSSEYQTFHADLLFFVFKRKVLVSCVYYITGNYASQQRGKAFHCIANHE